MAEEWQGRYNCSGLSARIFINPHLLWQGALMVLAIYSLQIAIYLMVWI